MLPQPRGTTITWSGLLLLACAVLAPVRAHAACPADAAALDATLQAVTEAFLRMDVESFYAGRDEARESLPCLDAPIAPSLAAAYHEMEAFNAFLGRDAAGTHASFRAARAALPEGGLPEELAIEGHPLFDAWREAALAPPAATEPGHVPDGEALVVDGHPADRVPVDRPAVVQAVGEGVRTAYVDGAGSVPGWLALGVPEPEPEPVVLPPPPPPERRRVSTPLLVASGATAAVAAGLLGGGLYYRGQFHDPETPYEDLESVRATANGFGIAAQVSAGVAVGLGGLAFFGGAR